MKMDRSGGVESEGHKDRMRNETAFRSAPCKHRSNPPLVCCAVCHFYKHSAQVSICFRICTVMLVFAATGDSSNLFTIKVRRYRYCINNQTASQQPAG